MVKVTIKNIGQPSDATQNSVAFVFYLKNRMLNQPAIPAMIATTAVKPS